MRNQSLFGEQLRATYWYLARGLPLLQQASTDRNGKKRPKAEVSSFLRGWKRLSSTIPRPLEVHWRGQLLRSACWCLYSPIR